MRRKKTDTKSPIIITILIILVIGLTLYIVADKVLLKEETTTTNNTKKEETTTTNNNNEKKEETPKENTTTNKVPTENEVKELMIKYIKKQTTVVDYRINSISFENNTKEFKELINEDQEHVLAYVDYDLIRDGSGYTKEQGWVKANQAHCILVKDSNGNYYVEKCGSGW